MIKIIKSSKSVLSNTDIKSAINDTKSSLKKTTEEATLATTLATTTLSENLKNSEKYQNSVDNLKATVTFLLSLIGSSTVKAFVGK